MHTMINLDKKSRVLPQGKDSIELQPFQVNSKMISSIKNNKCLPVPVIHTLMHESKF